MRTNTNLKRRKSSLTISLAASVAVLAFSQAAHTQSWQTVLNYQLAPGQFADGSALAADSFGNVFSGGTASDGPGSLTDHAHGLVLKTDLSVSAWYSIDDPTPLSSAYSSRVWRGLGSDSNRDLYSVGALTPKGSSYPYPSYWLVRKSSDSGLSWSSVDSFQYAAGLESQGKVFAADATGNIFVGGYGSSSLSTRKTEPNALHWLVRTSPDAGQTWTTVDNYYSSASGGFPKWGIPQKAHSAPGIGLFVVGQASADPQGYSAMWTVRRSLNGGTAWSTADLYQPGGNGYISCANAVASDNFNNIYVVGRADVPQVISRKTYTLGQLIVRKSSDGGNTWVNLDVVNAGVGKVATAIAACSDTSGKIVVAGKYQDARNSYHWIVRRPDALGQWQTVDDFQLAAGYDASPGDVVVDAAGNLLVSGSAYDTTGSHWIVRRLASTAQ